MEPTNSKAQVRDKAGNEVAGHITDRHRGLGNKQRCREITEHSERGDSYHPGKTLPTLNSLTQGSS